MPIQLSIPFHPPTTDGKVDVKVYNITIAKIYAKLNELQAQTTEIVINPTLATWTTGGRPVAPVIGQTYGYNTDYGSMEVFTSGGWLMSMGHWTTATRPSGLAIGSQGINSDVPTREYKFGSNDTDWNAI